MNDHIHLLFQLPPVLALAKAVGTIKANSSRWAGELGKDFAWQQGYGAFSVSASNFGAANLYRTYGAHLCFLLWFPSPCGLG
jgi:REP element-mobilizing transposase RayT